MSAELELARLERQVLAAGGVARWLKSTDTLRQLRAIDAPDIKRIVLGMVAPVVEPQALAAVLDAFGLGAKDALTIVQGMGVDGIRRTGRPSREARQLVRGLDAAGRVALVQAQTFARLPDSSVDDMLAPLFGHANRLRGSVSDAISTSGNEGVTAIADAAGLPIVWVAETDACVHCLAYSGYVVARGKPFPGGLTYGRKAYHTTPVRTPPRHPRCRCTLEPLRSEEYAEALRREADRSVLRGFSLESESMATRIDATDRLLGRGVDAPKTVIQYAERAVKRGRFTTRGRP